MTPTLKVQTKNGSCLDLETVVQQMDDSRFVYPGFIYTKNFEVLGAIRSEEFSKTIYARSFQASTRQIRNLSDLRGVKQTDCELITMPDAGGLPLSYKITASSANHLELELDRDASKEALDALHETHRDAIKAFPIVRKYTVKVPEATRIELTSTYATIPTECPKVPTTDIREEVVFNWTDKSGTPDALAKVDPAYWQRLANLVAVPGTQTPQPQPNADDGLIHLDQTASQALVTALAVRTYAPCR